MESYFLRRAQEIVTENGYAGYDVVTLDAGIKPWGLGPRPMADGVIQCFRQEAAPSSRPPGRVLSKSQGTGFFVADDKVVTNFHVIEKAVKITCYFDGEPIKAHVTVRDTANDLAVLKVDVPGDFGVRPLPVSSTAKVAGGEVVFTIGFPGRWCMIRFGRKYGIIRALPSREELSACPL